MTNQKKVVPNWNTVSTIVDRISIEAVKKAHFLDILDKNEITQQEKFDALAAIETQDSILSSLKEEFAELVVSTLEAGAYDYLVERRTFK